MTETEKALAALMRSAVHREAIKTGIHQRMQAGKVKLNYSQFLGYTKDADGNLIIVPEEAEVVQKIFDLYLQGYGCRKVKRWLEEHGIKTVTGKRLQVLILRYEGLKDQEIGEKLGYHRKRVSQLCAQYAKVGVEEYARNKYGGNHRALTYSEEAEIFEKFSTKAEKGEVVTVREIKEELDKKRGKDTGKAYVYRVLARHGWHKVMPRSRHPKAADEATIEASKKLTPQ